MREGSEKKYAEGCAINERKLYPPQKGGLPDFVCRDSGTEVEEAEVA